jgi:hypothetical protein
MKNKLIMAVINYVIIPGIALQDDLSLRERYIYGYINYNFPRSDWNCLKDIAKEIGDGCRTEEIRVVLNKIKKHKEELTNE